MAPKQKACELPRSNKKVKKDQQAETTKPVTEINKDTITKKTIPGKVKTNDNNMDKSPQSFQMGTFSPRHLSKEVTSKKEERPILELNQLLQKKTQLNSQGSICWKVYLFPPVHQLGMQKITQQFFGLDLVEAGTERTLWTHKPNIWGGLFETVKEIAKKGQIEAISDMFDGVVSCPVRAVCKGPNEIETVISAKGQKIQHWIMLIPMPADVDPAGFIQVFLSTFHELCKKEYIRSAYKSGVEGLTKHQGLISQVTEDGNYWYIMDNAFQKDIITKTCNCLSEVLLDYTILDVVYSMFGMGKNSDTWNEAIKAYAFEA
jgi:hypothetical protein